MCRGSLCKEHKFIISKVKWRLSTEEKLQKLINARVSSNLTTYLNKVAYKDNNDFQSIPKGLSLFSNLKMIIVFYGIFDILFAV